MFRVIRAAFSQRRKTAANAISAGMGIAKAQVLDAMQELDISVTARPEQLTLEHYAALSDALSEQA